MYNIADCMSIFIPLLEIPQSNNISWQTVIIAILPCLITATAFYLIHLSNKRTEQLKVSENSRFEIFKNQLNVYRQLINLISNILILSISIKVKPGNKVQFVKANLSLQEFIASNCIMISREIGAMLETFIIQEDAEPLRKTFNTICEKIDTELCLGETFKINQNMIKAITKTKKT